MVKNKTTRKPRITTEKTLFLRLGQAATRGTMGRYFLLPPHVTDVYWSVADLGKSVSGVKCMGEKEKSEIRKKKKSLSFRLPWLDMCDDRLDRRQKRCQAAKFAKAGAVITCRIEHL